MNKVILASETVKRNFSEIAETRLPDGPVYIREGNNKEPWIVMTRPTGCNNVVPDYELPLDQARSIWADMKLAIYAFHTVFCITKNGSPIAYLMPSEFPHPMRKYR